MKTGSAFDHSGEIVHGRIGVGAADAFDERGDRVVMLVRRFVVAQAWSLESLAQVGGFERPADGAFLAGGSVFLHAVEIEDDFHGIEQPAGVAVGVLDEALKGFGRERCGELRLFGFGRAIGERNELRRLQALEDEDAAAAQ